MTEEQVISKRVIEFGAMYSQHHPPLTTRFEEDVEQYWGRRWGVSTEVGRLRAVLLHKPGKEILSIQEPLAKWRYTEKPDSVMMGNDFERLRKALEDQGVEVVVRKAEENNPPRLVKSMYVRDPSFTVIGGVIIGRMYDALRRGEEVPTMKTYADIGCPILHTLHGSATMEGGSVVWLDPKHLAIGITYRGNKEGAEQVKAVVKIADPEIDVQFVPVNHESGHLDVPLVMVNVKTAVVDKRYLPSSFIDYLRNEVKADVIEKKPGTYVEGTLVLEPGKVLFDAGQEIEKKRGLALLKELGLEVIPVELNTLSFPRNSGTLHCLTMPLIRDPEPA
jgi:N-dimethylarginine dimethylaminohydrolase